ncbi:origin recognition complex subunit, putative [Perkinsus marinus ATCC 50983]|uniref:Origin recognition complex subunit, putative n=1 Tax=Perkinsus marinus (strain ATCC 50983 / TXsc) TaxID=423536 RepID=C5L189_PERM5|nr:origin recognition complex subunit, putative [Perkinsus marinus ATCC 50983]EER09496.1 origin recognition complex subunit, putative [Perkinsus marinus ATCC 50983]|eukprot:XP_002777680.1 origin recognition complex subunit, putative [Perkinsus marinus ATCC 50983]
MSPKRSLSRSRSVGPRKRMKGKTEESSVEGISLKDWMEIQISLRHRLVNQETQRISRLGPCKSGNGAREAADALLKLLKQSADLGESVSAVLIGPEGCGKSAALAAAVEELREQKPDLKVIVVHAKGSTSSSNDTAVLRDLYLKLVHEIQGREASLGLSSTAPSRQGWTFADYMAKVEKLIKDSNEELNCMVIVAVDRFHAFCHTAAKQTLLYNLFDVMQRPGIRLACVGMTNRDDVTFMLEKRIKSRFQLRMIQVHPPPTIDETRAALIAQFSVMEAKPLSQKYNAWLRESLETEAATKFIRQRVDRTVSMKEFVLDLLDRLSTPPGGRLLFFPPISTVDGFSNMLLSGIIHERFKGWATESIIQKQVEGLV